MVFQTWQFIVVALAGWLKGMSWATFLKMHGTVNRQAPLAMLLVTLVKAWYWKCAPWYPAQAPPSFADMLSGLPNWATEVRLTP